MAPSKTPATPMTDSNPNPAQPADPIRLAFGYDRDPNIAILTFDKPEASANLFDAPAFDALERHLATLEARHLETGLVGVILISAKPRIFIAGADIQQFVDAKTEEEMRALVVRGQMIFQRFAALPVPTVAAIHGACVGGGCEIALACDYRIASPDKATKIGLPEVKLGIVPGWGGCMRLPRLVGVPHALDIICGGKTLAAVPAKKRGLIDQVVPREHLLRIAATLLAKGKRRPPSLWKTNNPIVVKLARHKSTAAILAKTGKHYPAPLRAMNTVLDGLKLDPALALKLEEDAIVELGRTPVAQNLIRLFFLQERAKKISIGSIAPALKQGDEHPVAVLGAGLMGSAIAQWTAGRGRHVIMKDLGSEQIAKGLSNIRKLTDKATARHLFTETEARHLLDLVSTTTAKFPAHVDLVIEAAVENMAVKQKIFADLETQVGPDTLLATNTSALSITELATATRDPSRVVGIHFFNPVHRMQLVEVIRGEHTSDETMARSIAFVQSIGKMPVVVNDAPGFLVNRVLLPYLLEAANLVAGGAEIEEVDSAMKDFGMPMGPLRLLDEIGLDTALHVGRYFAETYPGRVIVPESVPALIEKGYLGKKAGLGYYTHPKKGEPLPNPIVATFNESEKYTDLSPMDIQARLAGLMVNESSRVLEEGVVATAADVDFGMVIGTGFAPFHGGPLRMADAAGVVNICKTLEALFNKDGATYEPSDLLRRLAAEESTFYKQD